MRQFPWLFKMVIARIKRGLLIGMILVTGSAFLIPQIAEETDPSKIWALIIGISNYTHAEPLAYAATDAQSFAAFLKSPRGGGLSDDHVFTLLEEAASRTGILYELEQMWDRVLDGHTIYVYIAGHGVVHPRRPIAYFVPSDGDVHSLNATSISFLGLQEQLNVGFMNARERILITDMCHSGTLEESGNLINEWMAKRFGTEAGGNNFLNLMASGPNEPSWELDDFGHGAFTYALLQALNGQGMDGEQVTAKDLVSYVEAEVPKYTASQQNPVANEGFDPNYTLSYLDRPGPSTVKEEDTFLRLENPKAKEFIRAQWTDPATESVAVRLIPPDKDSVDLGPLQPGSIQLRFFDRENHVQEVNVDVSQGENVLNMAQVALGPQRPGRRLVASLAPAAVPLVALPQAPAFDAASESQLVMQLDPGTQIYIDGNFYGSSADNSRPLQIQGLSPGTLNLRLVFSPTHEGRYRLELQRGPYLFNTETQELKGLESIEPPPTFTQPPAELGGAAQQLYRQFMNAIWREQLVEPAGQNAFEYFQQLRGLLTPDQLANIEKKLVVALGDKAQMIILRYLRGGDVRWSQQVFSEGTELVQRLRELFQDSVEYQAQEDFFRGRALLEADQFSQGREILQQAVSLDPNAAYVHNAIGLSYWREGQLNQALTSLNRAIDLAPGWNYPRITRALIFVEQRRYQEAETAFREALTNDPEDSTAHHDLGQLFFLTGRWAEAEQEVQTALQYHPGNAYAYQTLARIAQRSGRVNEAIAHLQLAIRLEPTEPAFRLSLAEIYQRQARTGEAQALYDQLLQDEPQNAEVLQAFARFNAALRRTDAAESNFAKAMELAPQNANIRVDYGIFLADQGRDRDAERQFRRALEIDPNNAFAHMQLAQLQWNRENVDQARREANRAIQADQRYYAPYRLLGQIHFALREHDQALQMFRKARDLALEGHQRLELQELIDQIEQTIVDEQIAKVDEAEQNRRLREAWKILADTLKRAPESRRLRNRTLEFQFVHPDQADPSQLPEHLIRRVLESHFWEGQMQAETLWGQNRQDEAIGAFLEAWRQLSPAELQDIDSHAFSFENETHGIHQIVYRWGLRLAETGHGQELRQLLQQSQDRMIFAVVPGVQPVTVDSLMRPEDIPDPKDFSDFEVAHHPDRRAHELFIRSFASAGETGKALSYLAAFESRQPDLELRLALAQSLAKLERWNEVRQVLEIGLQSASDPRYSESLLASAYILQARALCQLGSCPDAQKLLDQALERFPRNRALREARRQTG